MTYERKPHQTHIGPLSNRSANVKHFVAPRVEFDPSERITSFAKGGTYSQADDWKHSAQRPGCQDAFSLPSHGFRKANSDPLIVAQESATAESPASDSVVGQL